LSKKAVPVINENDTVSVDEIKFGDNDKLSVLVANLINADALIMLTDVEGLCVEDRTRCVDIVTEIDDKLEKAACGTDKEYSLGGMKAKLEACKIAMNSGVNCVVANGRKKNILSDILKGGDIGTFFAPKKDRLQSRKRWIAYNAKTAGKITVDDGAREALLKRNTSLLACGIKSVEGKFAYGDTVMIVDGGGREFARGLCNYNSEDVDRIKGMSTKDAEKIIEKWFYQEVVHRDNLVILQP
jgi:glutamate 5-kinase